MARSSGKENKQPNKGRLQRSKKLYDLFSQVLPVNPKTPSRTSQNRERASIAAAVPSVLNPLLFSNTPRAPPATLNALCDDSKVAATAVTLKRCDDSKVAATVIQNMARTSGILKVAATEPGILPQVLHVLCYTKWSINQYYCKMLLNGEAVPVPEGTHKNPGWGIYDIDVSKLTQLLENHKHEMSPLQIVACFILQHIHKLAHKTKFVLDLILTSHHEVPVANDCNGADIEVSLNHNHNTLHSRSLSHPFIPHPAM
jgi:hypothetical protein